MVVHPPTFVYPIFSIISSFLFYSDTLVLLYHLTIVLLKSCPLNPFISCTNDFFILVLLYPKLFQFFMLEFVYPFILVLGKSCKHVLFNFLAFCNYGLILELFYSGIIFLAYSFTLLLLEHCRGKPGISTIFVKHDLRLKSTPV